MSATVTALPAPAVPPVCLTCGGPARMALTVTSARPGRGYVYEQVWWDWRAAPASQAPRMYCKADGVRVLAALTDLFVAEDSPAALDPGEGPADPNATFLAHFERDMQ